MSDYERFILQKVDKGDARRISDIARVVAALEELPYGQRWRVTVEEQKATRTIEANAYYWGVVVEALSKATGYESEEVHEFLCGARWGWRDKRVPKKPSNPHGVESVPLRTTTTDENGRRAVLSGSDFWEFIEFARRFAAERANVVVPDPDPDYRSKREDAA